MHFLVELQSGLDVALLEGTRRSFPQLFEPGRFLRLQSIDGLSHCLSFECATYLEGSPRCPSR